MPRGQRTVWAKYLVRQRQFIEYRARAYGRPVASYGPWRTIARVFERARAQQLRDEHARVGLQQTIVTRRGKVVFDATGKDVSV